MEKRRLSEGGLPEIIHKWNYGEERKEQEQPQEEDRESKTIERKWSKCKTYFNKNKHDN